MDVEYLEKLVCQKVSALERLMNEKFAATEQAREIQAAEYSRRLDFLNGEAERLRQMQATYLPRESYEISRALLVKEIERNTAFRNNLLGRMAIISLFVASGTAILTASITAFILYLIKGV